MLPSDSTAWWAAFYFVRMAVFMSIGTLIGAYVPLQVVAIMGIYYALEFTLGDYLSKRARSRFGRG